ncbi:LysO family transporter [bacterium]|nr:LysO family transporter [bacterium]
MIVIGIFFLGVLVGTICKKYHKLFSFSEILTTVSLYLLLLFLGISIGGNSEIVSNMTQIGMKGLFFALASALGSILLILPLYLIFPKKDK